MTTPQGLLGSLLMWPVRWPVETQQRSRRNALVASTALTQLRRERDEVEEYLAQRFAERSAGGPLARHGVM
jgi:hypothetical protein